MGTIYLYLTLCAFGGGGQCTEARQQGFATAQACYQEGARRVNANLVSFSGNFIFIECRS